MKVGCVSGQHEVEDLVLVLGAVAERERDGLRRVVQRGARFGIVEHDVLGHLFSDELLHDELLDLLQVGLGEDGLGDAGRLPLLRFGLGRREPVDRSLALAHDLR